MWVQTDVLQCYLTDRLRTRRFVVEKRMLSIPYLTAFVVFLPFRHWGKNTVFNSLEKVSRVSEKKDDLFCGKPSTFFLWAQSFLHFSMSSPYSSKWRRTMFSTKLERLLPLSPNLRTMKSARSCVSRLRYTAFRLLSFVGIR